MTTNPPDKFMARRLLERIAEERELERAAGKDPAMLDVDQVDPETGEDLEPRN